MIYIIIINKTVIIIIINKTVIIIITIINNNTQIAAIALPPLTKHPQLYI